MLGGAHPGLLSFGPHATEAIDFFLIKFQQFSGVDEKPLIYIWLCYKPIGKPCRPKHVN
jgi:hypothetical protein